MQDKYYLKVLFIKFQVTLHLKSYMINSQQYP